MSSLICSKDTTTSPGSGFAGPACSCWGVGAAACSGAGAWGWPAVTDSGKADKAAPGEAQPSKRDKVSRSDGKAPDAQTPPKAGKTAPEKEAAAFQIARPVHCPGSGGGPPQSHSRFRPFPGGQGPAPSRRLEQINELMGEKRKAARAEVEKAGDAPAKEQAPGEAEQPTAGEQKKPRLNGWGRNVWNGCISESFRYMSLPSSTGRGGVAGPVDLEVEDIKHQGGRLKNVAEGDIGKRSVEIVGEAHDMNYKKVMRYLRLNSLVPELLDKVDDKKMGFMPAVELSYIKPKNQRLIAVSIDGEQASPSVAQAKKLRELDHPRSPRNACQCRPRQHFSAARPGA